MAVSGVEDVRDTDDSFLDGLYLNYIVPSATNLQLERILEQATPPYQTALDAIEQREWLFFDESVDVYLILRTPITDTAELRSNLKRVSVSLEAKIVNSRVADKDTPPPAEPIYNGDVGQDQEPVIVVDQELPEADGTNGTNGTSGTDSRHAFAIWKLSVFLCRPRTRLQSPSVLFSAAASLRAASLELDDSATSDYLQSRIPSGMNLLEAFSGDPALVGVKPRLSASRVSRVAPATQTRGQARPIKGLQSLSFKIYPAVHTRVRFSRPNAAPPSPALVALLEIDFSPYFDCEVILDNLALEVIDGVVEDLNTQDGMKLPLRCVAHDHITFLYRLAPKQLDAASRNITHDLDITIQVTALIEPDGPDKCTPHLSLRWTTPLDFTLPVNPGFGHPMTQPIQRSRRPSQLSISATSDTQSLAAPSVNQSDTLPTMDPSEAESTEVPVPEFGITMTFTGPNHPVHAGDEFSWAVFVVNRTKPDSGPHAMANPAGPAAAPTRKLALFAIPQRRRNDARVLRPPSTAGGGGGGGAGGRDPLTADAVLDENVVHAMQRSSVVDGTDVVCLSADVRVGPLAPDACAVAELRFLALREGVVGVEAVRVVDIGSQEHVDVRELPVVVVQGKAGA